MQSGPFQGPTDGSARLQAYFLLGSLLYILAVTALAFWWRGLPKRRGKR